MEGVTFTLQVVLAMACRAECWYKTTGHDTRGLEKLYSFESGRLGSGPASIGRVHYVSEVLLSLTSRECRDIGTYQIAGLWMTSEYHCLV
jgi:hypothetical protein